AGTTGTTDSQAIANGTNFILSAAGHGISPVEPLNVIADTRAGIGGGNLGSVISLAGTQAEADAYGEPTAQEMQGLYPVYPHVAFAFNNDPAVGKAAGADSMNSPAL